MSDVFVYVRPAQTRREDERIATKTKTPRLEALLHEVEEKILPRVKYAPTRELIEETLEMLYWNRDPEEDLSLRTYLDVLDALAPFRRGSAHVVNGQPPTAKPATR